MGGRSVQKMALGPASQHPPGSFRAAAYMCTGCVPIIGLSPGARGDCFSGSHKGISCQLVAALFPFKEEGVEAIDCTVLPVWLCFLAPWPGRTPRQQPSRWDQQNLGSVHALMAWERAPGAQSRIWFPSRRQESLQSACIPELCFLSSSIFTEIGTGEVKSGSTCRHTRHAPP